MRTPERAPLGAALAVVMTLLTLTGQLAPILTMGFVLFLVIFVAFGWPVLTELPTPRGSAAVIGLSGIMGATALLLTAGSYPAFNVAAIALALSVFLAFLHQMARPSRQGLAASLSGTVAGNTIALTASSWLLVVVAATSTGQIPLITALGAGLAVTLLLVSSPLPSLIALICGPVGGVLTTVLLGTVLLGGGTPMVVMLAALGLVMAVATVGSYGLLTSLLRSREPAASLAVAATPVATAGAIALIAVQLVGAQI